MYKNVCRHCHAEIECDSSRIFINHVRWCNRDSEKNRSYILRCSCTVCRQETTVQSLSQHLAKHDKSTEVKSYCPHCEQPIRSKNKFCNQSCAASYNNKTVDRSIFKCGPEKGWVGPAIPKNILRQRRIELGILEKTSRTGNKIVEDLCKVCSSVFRKKSTSQRKCCSKDCRMEIISKNRGRHKKSYLEESFSQWLTDHNLEYEEEVTFKNELTGKWYIVDFLFEHLKLIVELDGSHHEETVEYDRIRDEFLKSIGYQVLRITHKEYQSKQKLQQVCSLLSIPLQVKCS